MAKPIELIENAGGFWDARWNDDDEEVSFFCYYSSSYSIFKSDNQIIVNYKDGSSDTYTYDGEAFTNAQGEAISITTSANQESKPWVLGSDNFFTVECLGVSTQVPVTIKENRVASIQVVPAKPIELVKNTGGQWRWFWNVDGQRTYYYNYDYSVFIPGNQVIVNYKDGSSDTYTYDGEAFTNAQGDTIDVEMSAEQDENPWVPGGDNFFTVECLGVSTKVPVTIISSSQMRYIVSAFAGINTTVILKSDNNQYTVTAADGVFASDSIESDVYRVYAKQKNSVSVYMGEYDTKSGEVTNENEIFFPLGDVNGDDVIDLADVSLLLASGNYGQENTEMDLTGDNMITVEDISVILQENNYGAQSALKM